MKKILFAVLILLMNVTVAHADPLTALIGAISAGLSSITTAISSLGLISFSSLSAFLTSPIGSLVLGIGLQLVSSLFVRKPSAPSIEAGKVNVRLPEPERWICAGEGRQGGGVLFAEFDSDGNFWYLIVHSDSEHYGIQKRYFDDTEIEIGADNWVITDAFCLDSRKNLYSGSGTKVPYYRMWTTTYTQGNPTPPAIAELMAAFPGANGWTADHKLVGTTYSVVMVKAIAAVHRYKVFRWRGPIGLGEPGVSIVAKWSAPYDPRTGTYSFTENSALIWAWFRMHRYGRNKPFNSINWNRMTTEANVCDQTIVGIETTQNRYQCFIAVPDSKERSVAEQEIMMASDSQLVFDNDGLSWIRTGYWYSPSLSLTRNRDFFAMESVEAQNGESETQGVIVRYIDPQAKYTTQPCAVWKNPLYYREGQSNKYLNIDALAIKNHNQAFRLAKSIGLRSQAEHKIMPTVGLRGIYARQERICSIQYDNVFAGEYEIVTPVEVDDNGVFFGFGAVPITEDRFTLLPGEEQPKPVYKEPVVTNTLLLPTGVVIGFRNNRIEADFDAPPRDDWSYEFEAKLSTATEWSPMFVDMTDRLAYTGTVSPTLTYNIRYRTRSQAGKVTDWSAIVTLNDEDAARIISRMVSLGETPSYVREDLITKIVSMLKENSLWDNCDRLWFIAASKRGSAKIDWKHPDASLLSEVGTLDFKSDQGLKGSLTPGSYLNTGYNPVSGTFNFTQDSNCQAIYMLDYTVGTYPDIGNNTNVINNGAAGGFVSVKNSSTTTDTSTIAGTAGFIASSRLNSAGYTLYVNSSNQAFTRTSATMDNRAWFILAYNAASPQYSPDRCAFAGSWSGLTASQVATLKSIVEFYLRSIGAIT